MVSAIIDIALWIVLYILCGIFSLALDVFLSERYPEGWGETRDDVEVLFFIVWPLMWPILIIGQLYIVLCRWIQKFVKRIVKGLKTKGEK